MFPFLFVLLLLLFITNCSFFPHTQTHRVIQQFLFYLLKTAFLEPSILSFWSEVFVLLICYTAETSGLPFTVMRAFTGLIPLWKSPFPGTPGSTFFFGLTFCFGGSIFLGLLRNDVWEANVYISENFFFPYTILIVLFGRVMLGRKWSIWVFLAFKGLTPSFYF